MGDSSHMMEGINLLEKIEALQAQVDRITGKCINLLSTLGTTVLSYVNCAGSDLNFSRVRSQKAAQQIWILLG